MAERDMLLLRAMLVTVAALLLPGCIASTAAKVITAPVRAGAQVADWATTSQDEADRARGRAVRHREEELGRLYRERTRSARRCEGGDDDACDDMRRIDARIDRVRDAPIVD